MYRVRNLILIALLTFTGLLLAQTSAPPSRQPGGTDPASGSVNPAPQSSLIRILTPVAGQQLNVNFVNVRFELTNPAAYAGTPNFLVQLDGNDPVRTSTTSQNFTGLAPGVHSVTVQLVDANDTPIQGARSVVQFKVAQQAAPASQGPGASLASPDHEQSSAQLLLASYAPQQQPAPAESAQGQQPVSPQQQDDNARALPKSGSPLPLISVIGFGILVGGIVSAMKTRS